MPCVIYIITFNLQYVLVLFDMTHKKSSRKRLKLDGTCMLRPSSHPLCPVHQTLGGWLAAVPPVACLCLCLSARQVASSSHPTLQEREGHVLEQAENEDKNMSSQAAV